MSHPDSIRYFLFPHSVMAEQEARHLALLLPNLHLLEIVNPLHLPPWAPGHFVSDPARLDPDLSERVRRYLRDYADFAEVHRGSDTLSLLGQELQGAGSDPSRFDLQRQLLGRAPQGPDMRAWLRLEAAAFLELARELDEREVELEGHYRRMDDLEKSFREILGVIDGEEMEEVAEAASPPLVCDQNRFTYLLGRRCLSWYRVLGENLLQPDVMVVALTREIISELTDPIETEWERAGRELHLEQTPIAVLPGLREMPPADFALLRQKLLESGSLRSYWEVLRDAMARGLAEPDRDSPRQAFQTVREQIFEFCLQCDIHPKGQVTLLRSQVQGVSHNDLWRGLDKTGFEHLAAGTVPAPSAITLLHLEWSD